MSTGAKPPFYITTTLPYVNAEPHIGHALEFIRADIIARAKKLAGYEVFFNTGTDEHGIKIFQKAQQMHMEPQAYVDEAATKFKEILPALGMMPEIQFTRTTDPHHVAAAQEFWKQVDKNGLIYKKNYQVKYCSGCELEKTDSELVDGRCPLHPLQELDIREEENYFFRFSIFRKQLLDIYEKGVSGDGTPFVIPHSRLNEIRAFVERGLEDFSISRLASKMPWGIAVPGDETQVMYVWFDALVNYISTIGWPDRDSDFKKWWVETGGVVQYCGKDNLRQQSAMWQAMLLAAKLPPSKTIIINGFVTGEGGVKMSKSLGNTVDPLELIKEYGTDAFRYYVAREAHPFEDSPFTLEKFKETYNAQLANGLGNLVSRVMKMAEANGVSFPDYKESQLSAIAERDELLKQYKEGFDEYNIKKSMDAIWKVIDWTDRSIQQHQPFKLIKSENPADVEQAKGLIRGYLGDIYQISLMLRPCMPQTAETIMTCVAENKMPATSLFVRK